MLNFQKWKLPFHIGAVIDFIENIKNETNKNADQSDIALFVCWLFLTCFEPLSVVMFNWICCETIQMKKQTNKSQWRSQNA